jgi:hypothetical protein
MESVAILSHSFINSGGRIIPCRTALVDLGINDVDPGLAPEGARCDEGKLCVDRKCVPVENLEIGPNACPGKLSNNLKKLIDFANPCFNTVATNLSFVLKKISDIKKTIKPIFTKLHMATSTCKVFLSE